MYNCVRETERGNERGKEKDGGEWEWEVRGAVSRRLIKMKCVHEVYDRIHKQYHTHRNGRVRLQKVREIERRERERD